MEAQKISTFTNCIVTCVWADGKNRTPPVLFTYNQKFRRDRPSTERREEQVDYLDERLAQYGIDKDRVIYIGKHKGENQGWLKKQTHGLKKHTGRRPRVFKKI